jgi:hypothetical protein
MKILTILAFLSSCVVATAQEITYDLTKQQPRYSEAQGYGYDVVETPTAKSVSPFYFSAKVPDGNYRVTVTLGSKKRASQTVVRAESRRHYSDLVTTKKGKFQTVSFIVNKHEPMIDAKTSVKLKEREITYKNWNDVLDLQFCGPAPAVQRITIEPDTTAVTVFLCGNSTVVDQEKEPWAS